MIKKILVPIDGSEHADKATTLAGDIAEKYDAEVTLLHVTLPGRRLPEGLKRMAEVEHLVDPDQGREPRAVGTPGDTIVALRDATESDISEQAGARVGQWLLDQAEKRLRDLGTQNVNKRLEEGDAVETILATVDDLQPNLVVMGSRGLSDLKGLLIGSVSHKVSQLAACSCVTVK